MKKTTLAALVITLAASSAFAAAPTSNTTTPAPVGQGHGAPDGDHKGPGGPGGHMFEEIDTNKDGFISKDEWTAKGDKMFAELDANHDGKVSKDEMRAHHDMMHAKWEQHKAEGGDIKTPATNSAPKN